MTSYIASFFTHSMDIIRSMIRFSTFPIHHPTHTYMKSPLSVNVLRCKMDYKATKGISILNKIQYPFNILSNSDVVYFETNHFFEKILCMSKKKIYVLSDEISSPLVLNISGSHVFKVYLREVFTSQLASKRVSNDPSSNKAVMRLLLALRTKGGWATVSRLLGKRLNTRVIISDEDIVHMTNTANEILDELGFEPLTMGSAEEVDEEDVLPLFSDFRDGPLLSLERPRSESQTWMNRKDFSSPGMSASLVNVYEKSPLNSSSDKLELIDGVHGRDINKEMIFFSAVYTRAEEEEVVLPNSKGLTPPSEDGINDKLFSELELQLEVDHSSNVSQSSVASSNQGSSSVNSQPDEIKTYSETVSLQTSLNSSALGAKDTYKPFFAIVGPRTPSSSPSGTPLVLSPTIAAPANLFVFHTSSSADSGQGSNPDSSQPQRQVSGRAYSDSLSPSVSHDSPAESLVQPMEDQQPHQDGRSSSEELPNPDSQQDGINDNNLQLSSKLAMSQESPLEVDHSNNASQSSVASSNKGSSPVNSQPDDITVKTHSEAVSLQNSLNSIALGAKDYYKPFFTIMGPRTPSSSPSGTPPALSPTIANPHTSSSADSGQGLNPDSSQPQHQVSGRAYSDSLSPSVPQHSPAESLVQPMEDQQPHQDGRFEELPNPDSQQDDHSSFVELPNPDSQRDDRSSSEELPNPDSQRDDHSSSEELPNPDSQRDGRSSSEELPNPDSQRDGRSSSVELPNLDLHSPSPCPSNLSVSSHSSDCDWAHPAETATCSDLDNLVLPSSSQTLTSARLEQFNRLEPADQKIVKLSSEETDKSMESVLPASSSMMLTHLATQCVQTASVAEPEKTMAVFRN